MSQRTENILISPTDQVKYDQLDKQIQELQAELTWQELLTNNDWQEIIQRRITQVQNYYSDKATQEYAQQFHQDLTQANEKIDQLTDKLNRLRTLVRAGDINQLQDLVRQGRI